MESDAKKADTSWFSPAAIRETVESVIIAFVLAFLFRTFEAEAFVIPTGSMAPTLMGKHKDMECPMCHYRYQVSASDRQDHDTRTRGGGQIYHATCPMCRFTADLTPNNPQDQPYPTYDGDRILVAKFPYEFADPKRWDVIVFKYPGDATMNYIKRLVGLPGETISIHDGDLWIHKPDQPEGHFEIARKPPEKMLAMLQPVYDNDLAPTITGTLRWPAALDTRAGPRRQCLDQRKIKDEEDLSSFEIDGSAKGEAWIRYRHRVPTPEQWQRIAAAAGKQNRVRNLRATSRSQAVEREQAFPGQRAAAIDLGFYRLQYGLWRPVGQGSFRIVDRAGLRPALGWRPGRAVRTGVQVGIRQSGRRIGQGRPPFPVPFRPRLRKGRVGDWRRRSRKPTDTIARPRRQSSAPAGTRSSSRTSTTS